MCQGQMYIFCNNSFILAECFDIVVFVGCNFISAEPAELVCLIKIWRFQHWLVLLAVIGRLVATDKQIFRFNIKLVIQV